MNSLRSLLRDGDPIAREGELSPDEAARIRQQLRSELAKSQRVARPVFAVLTAAMILLAVGAALIARRPVSLNPVPVEATDPALQGGNSEASRQLQFVTPGGTRVFWTLRLKQEGR